MHDAAMKSVHFMSEKHDWETPQDFFDALDREFAFTVDAAASPDNAKCEKFWTYLENGLAQDWTGERVWVNPPYGNELPRWIEKAATSGADIVVMLIPARTDTKAWHRHIFGKAEIRFIEGRLKFGGCANAPFPSAIIVWGQGCSVRVGGCDLPLLTDLKY